MLAMYVIFSNSVNPRIEKINELDGHLYFNIKNESIAENEGNKRYKHYFKATVDEYGYIEYVYINTVNA